MNLCASCLKLVLRTDQLGVFPAGKTPSAAGRGLFQPIRWLGDLTTFVQADVFLGDELVTDSGIRQLENALNVLGEIHNLLQVSLQCSIKNLRTGI